MAMLGQTYAPSSTNTFSTSAGTTPPASSFPLINFTASPESVANLQQQFENAKKTHDWMQATGGIIPKTPADSPAAQGEAARSGVDPSKIPAGSIATQVAAGFLIATPVGSAPLQAAGAGAWMVYGISTTLPAGVTLVSQDDFAKATGQEPAKQPFFRTNNLLMWLSFAGAAAALGTGAYLLARR